MLSRFFQGSDLKADAITSGTSAQSHYSPVIPLVIHLVFCFFLNSFIACIWTFSSQKNRSESSRSDL